MFHPTAITKHRVAAISGLSFKSGTFGTYLASLKRDGFIDGERNDFIITEHGLGEVGDYEPLPTDSESLIRLWEGIVKGGAARMLRAITDAYPNSLSKYEVGEAANISHTSGPFGTYLATLKRNGLITVNGGQIKASSDLME